MLLLNPKNTGPLSHAQLDKKKKGKQKADIKGWAPEEECSPKEDQSYDDKGPLLTQITNVPEANDQDHESGSAWVSPYFRGVKGMTYFKLCKGKPETLSLVEKNAPLAKRMASLQKRKADNFSDESPLAPAKKNAALNDLDSKVLGDKP